MACWKCNEKIDPNMELNFFLCEDLHPLCMNCRMEGCSKCHCNKDIPMDNKVSLETNPRLRSHLKEQILIKKMNVNSEDNFNFSQPDLVTNGDSPESLINSLMINNMKKTCNGDSKNNILRNSRDSLHDSIHLDKCLMNFEDVEVS